MKKNEQMDEFKQNRLHIDNLLKINRAKALGLAVLLTVNTSLAGCASIKNYKEEQSSKQWETASPTPLASSSPYGGGVYHGGYYGGSYYYSRGGSYTSGSWGKYSTPSTRFGSSSYGRSGGASIGG